MTSKKPLTSESRSDAASDSNLNLGKLEHQMTCADCGATWRVTPELMFAGDDWLNCPNCSPAQEKDRIVSVERTKSD